ncbi:unnamed protein product [Oreochromis niloticus]|nr:unnamed protein product [Mustela putorius furo]
MDEADSDGGEVSFVQQATDASSEEAEKETEQEPNMPPRKRPRGTGKPSQSHTAKDGTVWVEEDIGMPSAVANRSCFTAQAGPTESAERKITSVLQSFLCLLDVGMLQTIRECTVHQARRTEPDRSNSSVKQCLLLEHKHLNGVIVFEVVKYEWATQTMTRLHLL